MKKMIKCKKKNKHRGSKLNNYIIEKLAHEFKIREKQVEDTVNLIDQGNTIPFIARYRKEVTGNLSDELLRDLEMRLNYLRNLQKRKEAIETHITEQGKMTEALQQKIESAITLQEVEDLYLPYKQKKKTRASKAKEAGLEAFALQMYRQEVSDEDIENEAKKYINIEAGFDTEKKVLKGAQDIIAETLADNASYRQKIREMVTKHGQIRTVAVKGQEKETTEFENYYDYIEPIKQIVDHRILAINRGEKQKIISVKILDPAENIIAGMKRAIVKGEHKYVSAAIEDAYKRLILPSIEREIRSKLKERAEESAIKNFGINLKKLLLQPPFKGKTTMGFDPAFRTGCKIAVINDRGTLLDTCTVYPTDPRNDIEGTEKVLIKMIEDYQVDLIAIGNGTASRESEKIVADMLKKVDRDVSYVIVNEAGASVYSASKLGTEEYPDINVSLRGAISIAGRLQDPLAELVKIDPKHIGVGQYQHDVNQKALEKVLDNTVEDAVNRVGVDINRASSSLLKHIAGVSKTVAKNIITYREQENGFKNRKEILKVKGLGNKAFEQCAGFLRISDGDNILDNTGVHPESYALVEKLLDKIGCTLADLEADRLKQTTEKLNEIDIQAVAEELETGVPTLLDIVAELKKPGRDPRDGAPKPFLKSDVLSIKDLVEGMLLTGTVRNVIDFGAFIDIGVHQDGLVHISEISNRYIKHPSEVLAIGDVVEVRVLTVDLKRNRIGLSMKL